EDALREDSARHDQADRRWRGVPRAAYDRRSGESRGDRGGAGERGVSAALRKAAILGALPLGVIGNTPDSGSGESWFEPRRGNSKRDATMSRVALLVFPSDCHRFCHRFSRHLFDIISRDADFGAVAYKRFAFHVRKAPL